MTIPRCRGCAAILTLLSALLLVAAASAQGAGAPDPSIESCSVETARGVEIERSPADTRDYRAFVLDNGLEALVVSDPDADEGAAALNVNVGSGSDPEDRAGLAHFLEHMLFLGTEKYPDAGEYGRFLAEHGGSSNATTSFAHTSYFFDVDAEYLEGALDRFAQFFIAPRFDPEYVGRERQVVHSEYISRRRSDRLRGFAAWREALDPRHPLSKFLAGNAETLADRPGADIRDDLIDFHARTYSSHLMKLVVVGREPLEVLEGWVRARFAAVPRRDHDPPRIDTPLYPEDLLPARLEVEPIRELRALSLSFALPSMRPDHRAHPLNLVSHLLGHEGRGSLLSALKAQGWAEGLSAGPGMRHRDFATFRVTIQLTEAGLAHRDDLVAAVFAYLRLIRAQGIEPRYHEEFARMARIGFRFQEKAAPRSWAVSLASALHIHPAAEVLTAPWRFDDFDPEVERRFLSFLTPDRVLMTVVAKGVTTDSVDPFYDTPYRLTPIPADTVARWRDAASHDAFALPAPNPFLPDNLELIDASEAGARPERIVSRPGFDLWHHADVEFGPPRTNFYFSVRSPIAGDSPRHAVLSALLVRMANDALNEFAYPAVLAGQSHALYRHRRGLTVRLSGWSDKQDLLLARIVSTLRALPLPADRFEAEKTEYARRLRNIGERSPTDRAMGGVRELLLDPYWSEEALLEALDAVALDDLREYAARFFERGMVVALAHGNVTEEGAKALGRVLERELLGSMRAASVMHGRVVRLDSGPRPAWWLDSRHEDHALVVYRQGRDRGFPERATMALLAQAAGNRFFHELRTEREIGYIVFATLFPLLEVPGLALVVQSPSTPPEALHREVDGFIDRFGGVLRDMPPSVFERHRAAVESALLEAETQLDERTERYWHAIDREHYGFDRRERLLEAVRAVGRDDLAGAWRDLVADPDTARGLVVAVSSRESSAAGAMFGGADAVTKPGPEPGPETKPGPGSEPGPGPETEAGPEPMIEGTPETMTESGSESEIEPETESEIESFPALVTDPAAFKRGRRFFDP